VPLLNHWKNSISPPVTAVRGTSSLSCGSAAYSGARYNPRKTVQKGAGFEQRWEGAPPLHVPALNPRYPLPAPRLAGVQLHRALVVSESSSPLRHPAGSLADAPRTRRVPPAASGSPRKPAGVPRFAPAWPRAPCQGMTLQGVFVRMALHSELHGAFGEDIGCRGVIRHAGVRGNLIGDQREPGAGARRKTFPRRFLGCCPIRLLLPTMMGWMTRRQWLALAAVSAGSLQAQRGGMASRGVKPTPRASPPAGHSRPLHGHRRAGRPARAGHLRPSDHVSYILETTGPALRFWTTTTTAGWTSSCSPHAPGWSAAGTTNRLYKNNRDGTFTDVTERAGLTRTGWASA